MRASTLLFACALIAAPLGATAQVSININIPGLVQAAPPPPRYEPLPPPRAGYVWVPGNWQWQQQAYGWRQGFWQPQRPDYDYAPGRWVRVEGGWRWVEPGWRPARYGQPGKHRGHGDEDRHEHRHDDGDHDRDGYHCPPGQAKKGRC